MRQSRLRKFRKNKAGMLIFIQLIAIYYLGVYGLFELTSPTNAAFNDVESLTMSLKAADKFNPPDEGPPDDGDGEWDKSSLKFTSQASHCQDGTISAVIQNGKGSRDMKGPVTYEVYWAQKGNPKPDKGGTKVASGQVPALSSGETFEMFYTPTKPGNYMFRAEQRPGHPGKGELWSKAIEITQNCLSSSNPQSNTIQNHELEQNIEEQNKSNNKSKDDTKNSTQSREKENNKKPSEETSRNEINQQNVKGADKPNENHNEMD